MNKRCSTLLILSFEILSLRWILCTESGFVLAFLPSMSLFVFWLITKPRFQKRLRRSNAAVSSDMQGGIVFTAHIYQLILTLLALAKAAPDTLLTYLLFLILFQNYVFMDALEAMEEESKKSQHG